MYMLQGSSFMTVSYIVFANSFGVKEPDLPSYNFVFKLYNAILISSTSVAICVPEGIIVHYACVRLLFLLSLDAN